MYWAHRALNGTADHSTLPDDLVTVAEVRAWMSTAHVRRETLTTLVETLTGAPTAYVDLSVEVVRDSAADRHVDPPGRGRRAPYVGRGKATTPAVETTTAARSMRKPRTMTLMSSLRRLWMV